MGSRDELRANSKLKSSEYSVPVFGLISLRYADHRFTTAKAKGQGSEPLVRLTIRHEACSTCRKPPGCTVQIHYSWFHGRLTLDD
jgi:hypothetical protein